MNYRNTYHILLMGGMAPIPMEVCADMVKIETGVFRFLRNKKTIAIYPVLSTVIKDIEENPNYVAPAPPERDINREANMMRGMMNRRG